MMQSNRWLSIRHAGLMALMAITDGNGQYGLNLAKLLPCKRTMAGLLIPMRHSKTNSCKTQAAQIFSDN